MIQVDAIETTAKYLEYKVCVTEVSDNVDFPIANVFSLGEPFPNGKYDTDVLVELLRNVELGECTCNPAGGDACLSCRIKDAMGRI